MKSFSIYSKCKVMKGLLKICHNFPTEGFQITIKSFCSKTVTYSVTPILPYKWKTDTGYSHLKSGHIEFLGSEGEQCSETYIKTIFLIFVFDTIFISNFRARDFSPENVDEIFCFVQISFKLGKFEFFRQKFVEFFFSGIFCSLRIFRNSFWFSRE